MRLMVQEPEATCEVEVGKFSFTTKEGEHVDADFFIKTCADSEQADLREEQYNEQLTDEMQILVNSGVQDLVYKEIMPSPIF